MRYLFGFALFLSVSLTSSHRVQGSEQVEYLDYTSLSSLKLLPPGSYQGFEAPFDSGKPAFRFVLASNLDGKYTNSIRSRGLNTKKIRNWALVLGSSYLVFRIFNAIYHDPSHLREARRKDHTILYPTMTDAFNSARSDYLNNGGPSEAEFDRDLKSIPRNSPAFIARVNRHDQEEKKKWDDLPQFEKDLEAKIKANAEKRYDDSENLLKSQELKARRTAHLAFLLGATGASADVGLSFILSRLSVIPQIQRIERKTLEGEIPILWIDSKAFAEACSELNSNQYLPESLDAIEIFLHH